MIVGVKHHQYNNDHITHQNNCQYWRDNKDSMLNFLLQVHTGLKGIVRNEEEEPVVMALVAVGKTKPVKTTSNGEYWKLILPGNYSVVSGWWCWWFLMHSVY